uniref:Uncharacterized protein n=1 Tax=viral metagenome TaxID=1070528 RepID=A0A6M3L7E8_9ZZZZ
MPGIRCVLSLRRGRQGGDFHFLYELDAPTGSPCPVLAVRKEADDG